MARKYEYCVVCYLKTEIVINKTKFDVYSDERMAECACYPSKWSDDDAVRTNKHMNGIDFIPISYLILHKTHAKPIITFNKTQENN